MKQALRIAEEVEERNWVLDGSIESMNQAALKSTSLGFLSCERMHFHVVEANFIQGFCT